MIVLFYMKITSSMKNISFLLYFTHHLDRFARPTSNRFHGAPFIPIMAKAVDLFPQTRHVEAVILFERVGKINTKI